MKTICGVLALSVMVLALSVLTVTALSAMGDVNKDGAFDMSDIRVMFCHSVKDEPLKEETQLFADGTDAVTTQDVCGVSETLVRETATTTVTTTTATTTVTTTATTTTTTTTTTVVTATTTLAITLATEPTLPVYAQVEPFPLADFEQRMFDLINEERTKAGVAPLRFAYEDYECAKLRAREQMQAEGHTRPDGRGSKTVYEDFGMAIPEYRGENLALYQPTPEIAMEGLMNSPGHKANILNENYTAVAVGVEYDAEGYPLYTQLFKR